ncbi:M23 family metallopeptidase [Metabacillus sp. RGM 3146]|uniref:M23 family metallopeptidase n=1 Tax=Metabacillus sp. RGM 3146 TaxID=3401092 RepID=UPI003B994F53
MRNAFILIALFTLLLPCSVSALSLDDGQMNIERKKLYKLVETKTKVPWYLLGAVDQFEKNVRRSRKDLPKQTGLTGLYIPSDLWSGPLNPKEFDDNPATIRMFGGIGQDGNGDGIADQKNDLDSLYTFAKFLSSYGHGMDNLKIGLWDYYQRDKSEGIIMGHMKLIKKLKRFDLNERAFPVALGSDYSYRSTWGDARGWGGRRIHEGTDIFAHYGVSVRSTCYGIIEMKGWNRFGGWRVGIRDFNNTYHYYAHLNGFAKGLEEGQIVKPGQVIGSVGSSGYGPPGTAGKFPPHLHYGMYKDNGKTEWSFDPYPHLRMWEGTERKALKKRKS